MGAPVEAALLLATARGLLRDPALPALPRVRSLHYYLPVVAELEEQQPEPEHLHYGARQGAALCRGEGRSASSPGSSGQDRRQRPHSTAHKATTALARSAPTMKKKEDPASRELQQEIERDRF